LGSVGLQPTKNLLFIARICFPRLCFWTDILRPLVSFPSPLQEVGILCVCLCLVVFLLDLALYRVDVLVHSLCMIPKDALLFVRYRIYRFLSGLSALILLRRVHVPCQEVDTISMALWSTSFLLRRVWIYFVCPLAFFCLEPDLLFHVSFRNSSSFLSCDISSFLLESLSCCVFIAFIAICKSSGGVSVTICKLAIWCCRVRPVHPPEDCSLALLRLPQQPCSRSARVSSSSESRGSIPVIRPIRLSPFQNTETLPRLRTFPRLRTRPPPINRRDPSSALRPTAVPSPFPSPLASWSSPRDAAREPTPQAPYRRGRIDLKEYRCV